MAAPLEFASFENAIQHQFDSVDHSTEWNEAVTEQELIRPVLELLGWTDFLPQQGSARNEDIPDLLLFPDADSKLLATDETNSEERYRLAIAVEESKRFGLPLDSRDRYDSVKLGTPHGQILRYLSTADIVSNGNVRWGILTNGGTWRLYDYRTRPRATAYFEVRLSELLKSNDSDGLRLFFLLFYRESFIRQQGATASFLETALAEGRRYEERVAQDLSSVVFDRAFPQLLEALATRAEDKDLAKVREAALILLYRLLFVLYAEDRGLLPVNDSRYEDYGLRRPVREHIANRIERRAVFSANACNYFNHLMTLCNLIDKGDPSIGLPPYNGGLFASSTAPLLEEVQLSDQVVASIIYDLSHTEAEGVRRFVNYRDMSVQQLGSIYERLLEREPTWDEMGKIVVRPNRYARKDSGSFFTPQELVDLIVDRTLNPLVKDRLRTFEAKAAELKGDRRTLGVRRDELQGADPAEAVLNLRILDPAMGSGHFLVTAVDFLSDYIADLIEYVPAVPGWLSGEYVSPLVGRIDIIRQGILRRARESDWVVDESQLTDQAIIRRMVLKRCIYGVDKNPLTVELAKVSLWLHSFTTGAPLSFLDHHLRCGDSLVGLRVGNLKEELQRLGHMYSTSAVQSAENAVGAMQQIEGITDADISEVRESTILFKGIEQTTTELRTVLDTLSGTQWLSSGMKKRDRNKFEEPLVAALALRQEDVFDLMAKGPDSVDEDDPIRHRGFWPSFDELWNGATALADSERFLHWEVAYPGIWERWQDDRPIGGFDAIIGNPPWDRIKLQEVEWFSARAPELALAPTAAARRTGIKQLQKRGVPLAKEFEAAKDRADKLSKLIRTSGQYPLMGGGDINLYSLFVERAMSLVKPDGLVGLLTPSGIYGDKTAAKFFKSLSTSGRLAGLFDFENRRLGTGLAPFFPDVDSRFKFCALIFGGENRRFTETSCAFFLHDVETIKDQDRCFPMAPEDFVSVNPNTGTAPVFRRRRDAEITRRIYENHPVMVDRSQGEERRVWPVRYRTMFHMTNDSHLFRTAAQLEAEGFYPVQGNRWKRGSEEYLPLYEGKMVQAFDHRAASVVVNPANLNRPGQPLPARLSQHANPEWLPSPRFWVPASKCGWPPGVDWILGFKEITASTNVRTFIAALLPSVGFGNKLPIFVPKTNTRTEWMLTANFNSMAFDFVARQKLQGQTLNLFIVEQLPVVTYGKYSFSFGSSTAGEIVRDHVLRLTYTASDMAPFARDLGHTGPPFAWDEEERRHLRARLDALYFRLYGLSKEDADYILDTFPIVRREDEARFGTYRTRDLILAYMNALAAGDTRTIVRA